MMDDRAPDETINVAVDGYNVVAYSFGAGDEVLFCVNGGPGAPLRLTCATRIPGSRTGATGSWRSTSSAPASPTGPTTPRSGPSSVTSRETETVRTALGLGPVHYYGQSWGTWLGQEWALTYPESFKTITLANGGGRHSAPRERAAPAASCARPRDRGHDAAPRGGRHPRPSHLSGGDHHPQLPPRVPARHVAAPP